jgi:hypothetical protein
LRKLILLTTLAGLFNMQTNSQAQNPYYVGPQSPYYVGLIGGYGFPSGVQQLNNYNFGWNGIYNISSTYAGSYTYNQNTATGQTSSASNPISQSFSLGSGTTIGMYSGYMLTKNIGLELGISNKFSSSTSATQNLTENYVTGPNTVSDVYVYTYTLTSGNAISLTPSIRLTTDYGYFHPYMVTGLIIGFPPSVTMENSAIATGQISGIALTPIYSLDEITTYSGGMMYGYHGAIGVSYDLINNISISGEIFGNFMNWAPKKSLITTLTYNGIDSLPYKTTSYKQTNYVASPSNSGVGNGNTATSSSPGTPTQSTYIYMPFSSFGIRIAIHIILGAGKVASPPK